MTATSAKRLKHWDLAAARCIAGCKNTAWNETLDVRTSHTAPCAGGGSAWFFHRANSPVEWPLFFSHRLDADISDLESVAGVRSLVTAARSLLAANSVESSLRHARRGFFLPRTRRQQRRRTGRSDDGSQRPQRNPSFSKTWRARSHRFAARGNGRNRRRHLHLRQSPAVAFGEPRR